MAQKPKQFYSWQEIEKMLTKWAEEQEEWANDYWMPDKVEQQGYHKALRHLKYHLKHPITEII
jgi:hypothetical protein